MTHKYKFENKAEIETHIKYLNDSGDSSLAELVKHGYELYKVAEGLTEKVEVLEADNLRLKQEIKDLEEQLNKA